MQVGCLAHCYGTTTLDTSGLTLAQIEQLLGELHVPTPPTAGAAPGADQSATQQTAAQSQNGGGHQSQAANQLNGTTQVVVTSAGAPADGGTGAAVVNQTAQGIVQLQVGCIFYCTGTQQTQSAQQSNATVQAVDGAGAGAENTVSRVVWQVQVGCLAWCYDAVETQTSSGTDSTVVDVPPPADATAPVVTTPAAPVPVAPPISAQPSTGRRIRDSGGAAVRIVGAGLGVAVSGTSRPATRSDQLTAVSVSAAAGQGALVSLASSRVVQTEGLGHVSHSRHQRHSRHHHGAVRPDHAAPSTPAGTVQSAVARGSTALPSIELTVALMLAALAFGSRRWRRVR